MTELSRLERFEQRTEWPLAGVAFIFLALYSIQVLLEPAGGRGVALQYALFALYFVFVADYLARLYLADPRAKWFFRHLLDLAIVVLPFLRPLRLLALAVVLNALQRALGHTIRGKVIVYTVFGAVLIVYAASLAVFDLEHEPPRSQDQDVRATPCGGRCRLSPRSVMATWRPSPVWGAW